MLNVKDEVTNSILKKEGIPWSLDCGVGVDYGDVIVTKIGINDIFDVKAYGNCINKASKYSEGSNEVVVGKAIREAWPTSEGGRMRFAPRGDAYVLSKKT